MEELTVCRICLLMDVRMYDLQSQPLNLYFGSITGSNLSTIENCPPYACFECAALVKKFYLFKQKCLKSQDLLQCLVNHNIKITATKLKQIDRQGLGLSSKLTTQMLASGSVQQFINKEGLINQEPTVENVTVKKECEEPIVENIFIKQEPTFENIEPDLEATEIEACDIKEENNLLLADEYLSNDELSLQDNHIKVDHHDIDNDDICNNVSDNLDVLKESQITKDVPRQVVPKKIKRVPKKLIDELLDDVTVTELTLEEQIAELNKRKESSNYLNSPIKCELCFKGFGDSTTWKKHLQKHSPSAGLEECPVCKLRFKTARCMGKHWKRHLTKYACNYCTHVSSDPSQAKNHLGQHKGVEYTCERCDLTFAVLTTYLSHVRIKHSSDYICDLCGGPFVSKLGLYRHRVMVHKYDKDFDEFLSLAAEVKVDTQWEENDTSRASTSKTQQQTTLSTTSISNGSLICHETTNGGEELKKPKTVLQLKKLSKDKLTFPAECEYCCKKIENIRSYRAHCRLHYGRGNYPCRDCGKSFQHHTNLLYHGRWHSGEKLYKCGLCRRSFPRLCDLQQHGRAHRHQPHYVCDHCRRTFRRKSAIEKHIAIHSSVKPYQCSICNKTFTTLSQVNEHVVNVHATKPGTFNRRLRSRNTNKNTLPH